ncbi:MAG TPA: ElyC/SanA/YdcF family protein [Candidatus Sulfotelmatobacter sp.]|nr:ElyC/SanA/YdcF family protein [Candidatus Sulfotelmatobacter sp.]
MKTQDVLRWFRRNRFVVGAGLAGGLLAIVTLILWADHTCELASRGRIYRSIDAMPEREVGLVLGTSRLTRRGKPNLHFNQRIAAAVALYRAGKVHHLLVSGDNHVATYDEPTDMRNALVAAGVPTNAITCDYAGFHTLDSVVRAKLVFGLSRCTIISEEFHCPRALWIAQQHDLDAVAFAAPDVSLKSWSVQADVREQLARAWCGVDLYLLHRGPKFPGPREPILISSIQP